MKPFTADELDLLWTALGAQLRLPVRGPAEEAEHAAMTILRRRVHAMREAAEEVEVEEDERVDALVKAAFEAGREEERLERYEDDRSRD